jgi:hypothetical protein
MVGPTGGTGSTEGTGNVIPSNDPETLTEENAPLEIDTYIDQIEQMIESDDNINTFYRGQINLPRGRISLSELTALINKVIQELKIAIHDAQQLDPLISLRYHRSMAQTSEGLEALHTELYDTVMGWIGIDGPSYEEIIDAHTNLTQATDDFNTLMETTWGADRTAIQKYNAAINTYNTLTPEKVTQIYESFSEAERAALLAGLTEEQITAMGGEEQAVVLQHLNNQIAEFNAYAASRPDIQAAINNIQTATAEYQELVDKFNENIDTINVSRANYGLTALPHLESVPPPEPTPLYVTLPEQAPLPQPLLPTENRDTLPVPNTSQKGTISEPIHPGDPPEIEYWEMMAMYWIPVASATLSFLGSFNRALDLSNAYLNLSFIATMVGNQPLTLPFGYLESVSPLFLGSANSIGGIGLAAHALGLHSRTLEIVLSRAMFQGMAQNHSLPISARLFARIQFTALELLSKSSLLSSLPAVRFLASRFGFLAASSPAVQASIALAFAGQMGSLVSSGIVRAIVNGQINRLGFYGRHSERVAHHAVMRAERGLQNAIQSGNPFRIASAVNRLVNAQVRLANAVRLQNTFGFLSIGSVAAFTNQIAASMNLSLLGISTSLYAQALGIPNLVPLLFAQVTHLAPSDLLIAMTSGSTIMDILDNPMSILFAKQTLANQLVFQLGYSTGFAAAIVNRALNNIILSGAGINTYSRLRNELIQQFKAEGLNGIHAHSLANETLAMIRGDMGAEFLNVAFGLNIDASLVASSLVNSLFGMDIGIAGAMLSNAVVRSLQFGGFGSRVRLRNELTEQFQGMGLNRGDAFGIASQYINFLETVGIAVPLNRFPGLASVLLGSSLLQNVAFGRGIVAREIIHDLLMRGLNNTQAQFIAEQLSAIVSGSFIRPSDALLFELALKGAVERALLGSSGFETQREFRDQLSNELRSVGFSRNDALFLANSMINYGVTGNLASLFGETPANIGILNSSLVNELKASGISGNQAQGIVDRAYANVTAGAPYFSPDDFKNKLKEEIFLQTILQTGRLDGHVVFDRAVANASDASQILGLAGLIEQISGQTLGILRPDVGTALAQELHHQLLRSLLGGVTVDEIANEEQRNPLSLLSLINDQVKKLEKEEETADLLKTLRKLIQLLQKLMTPNAEVGYLLSTISDNAGTFFGAANISKGGENFQPTQIPV